MSSSVDIVIVERESVLVLGMAVLIVGVVSVVVLLLKRRQQIIKMFLNGLVS